jgi:hypothetical protein
MKLFFFLLVIVLETSIVKAQNNWIEYKIDDKLSVKLPKQPVTLNEHSVYIKDQDTTIYVITKVDMFKTDGLDSSKLASLATSSQFTSQIKNSLQREMKGSALGELNIGKWRDFICYNVEGDDSAKKIKFYTETIIVGTNLYGLMIILRESQKNNHKDDFFNSLKLN